MNYEEMKQQYEKTFEIYSDDRFEEIISIKDLEKIVRCYDNFDYCHQNGLKLKKGQDVKRSIVLFATIISRQVNTLR